MAILFGQHLRDARIAAGLSQEALADRAGLSPDTIAALERGRRRSPRPSTINALARVLRLTEPERLLLVRSAGHLASAPAGSAATAQSPSRGDIVGRDGDIEAIGRLLSAGARVRFVTLVGVGGIGKSTLARAVLRSVRDRFVDGCVFVELSQIDDPTLVVPTIGQALPFDTATQTATTADFARAVGGRLLLLVLDGVEQLAGAGQLVAEILDHAGELSVLVTSRIPLGATGEHRYAVRPLPVADPHPACSCPGPCWCVDPAVIAAGPAVTLFTRRVRSVAPEFKVDQGNAATVARICARLGGIPLALELAAARMPLLGAASLLDLLDHSLDALALDRRRPPGRDVSLRATLMSSLDLLDDDRQRLFASLGVFRGSFDVPAVIAVCAGLGATPVLDQLQSLTEIGFLVPSPAAPGRLTMLETLRRYAREHLEAQSRVAASAGRHLRYYLALAEDAAAKLIGPDQANQLQQLEDDHDNLRAAASWALENDSIAALRLAVAMWRFWQCHGHLAEGRRRLDGVLGIPGGPADLRAEAAFGAAVLAFAQGDLAAASIRAQQALGSVRDTADTLNLLANIAREQGHHRRATTLYEESLILSRQAGNLPGMAATLNNLGTVARYQGDLRRARQLHEESLSLRVRLSDTRGLANCLENLAQTAAEAGEPDSALRYGLESLALREQLGDRHGVAVTLATLCRVQRSRGDRAGAAGYAERALAAGQAVNDVWVAANTLATMVGLACDAGDWAEAGRLAGSLSTYQELTGATLRPAEAAQLAAAVALAEHEAGRAAFGCAWTLGRTIDIRRNPAAATIKRQDGAGG